ncbi:hypothetical protein A5823_002845 [Enterococcus faecalis]|uniref:hypothetical protein n=1 Tax=Enterococcus faecalis TaxID=1351 RepID=UPI000B751BDA|nr:hypothetical protein [Enterococcus faecalis]OTP25089.1 hypothetical protein A5823_002845 [Enterococcus faecalis]
MWVLIVVLLLTLPYLFHCLIDKEYTRKQFCFVFGLTGLNGALLVALIMQAILN